jgi:hypothetical protein
MLISIAYFVSNNIPTMFECLGSGVGLANRQGGTVIQLHLLSSGYKVCFSLTFYYWDKRGREISLRFFS